MKYIATYKDYKLLNESLVTAKQRYVDSGEIDSSEFDTLLSIDTTSTKKYIEKICQFYLEELHLGKLKTYIPLYDSLVSRNLVDKKDINQFKTFNEFQAYVDLHKNLKSKSEIDKSIKEGAELVYEDDNYLILYIKNREACRLYGRGTKWCITMDERNTDHWGTYIGQYKPKEYNYNREDYHSRYSAYNADPGFEKYTKEKLAAYNEFYFIIDKTKDSSDKFYKVAVQINYHGKKIFWDSLDDDHTQTDFLRLSKFPKNLLSLFKFRKLFSSDIKIKDVSPPQAEAPWSDKDLKLPLEEQLKKLKITNYKINSDGTVDVDGDVVLSGLNLVKIPIKFGKVTGKFVAEHCQLTTLENSPYYVGGDYKINNNNLTTLDYPPRQVGGRFISYYSTLTKIGRFPLRLIKSKTQVIGNIIN